MTQTLSVAIEKRYPDITIRASFEQRIDGYRSTALFGPSGCGKTTILRVIAGLTRPEQGRIHWNAECLEDTTQGTFVRPQHRRVGLLFQDYALFPHMNVERNIGYGLPRGPDKRRAIADIMERFQISGMNRRRPSELSGGQQQRVALARAVIRRPRLLLLDEPLSALDATTRQQVRRELRELLVAGGIPALIVTHDPIEAVTLAEHILVMDRGRILQQGPAEEVFSRPADLAVANIVGVETVQRGVVVGQRNALVEIRVGTAIVRAAARDELPRHVDICIRAEDVLLFPGEPGRTSAQNILKGRITEILAEGPLCRVVLDCGFPLTSLISKQARANLGLSPGDACTAVIKATAVHAIPGT